MKFESAILFIAIFFYVTLNKITQIQSVNCHPDCQTCQGGDGLYTMCLTCTPPLTKNGSTATPGVCCVENCIKCLGQDLGIHDNCITCIPTMVLNANSSGCINITCHTSCATCSSALESGCLTCTPPRTLNAGFCCNTNCKTCSSSTTCTACDTGYFLDSDGICYTSCTAPKQGVNGVCITCNVKCLTCTNTLNTGCLTCTGGKQVMSPAPNFCCPVGCGVCSDENTCTACTAPQLYDTKSKTCVATCPVGSQVTSQKCIYCDPSCLTCQTEAVSGCLTCSPPLILAAAGAPNYCCPQLCDVCVSSVACTKCTSPNFLDATTNKCAATCPASAPQKTSLNTCILCDLSCKTCDKAGTTGCTSCNPPSLLSGGVANFTTTTYCCIPSCLVCNGPTVCGGGGGGGGGGPICVVPNYFVPSTGLCVVSCPVGMQSMTTPYNQCIACDITCATCINAAPSGCTACKGASTLPDLGTPNLPSNYCCPLNCIICGPNCSKCKATYFVNLAAPQPYTCVLGCPAGLSQTSTDTCIQCNAACLTCETVYNNGCVTCNAGYHLNGAAPNYCCLDECQVCGPLCTLCVPPKFLDLTNPIPNCIIACSSAHLTGAQLINNASCIMCNTNCLTCAGTASNQCLTCQPPKQLQASASPSGYCCGKDCLECNDAQCTKCQVLQMQDSLACVAVCPPFYSVKATFCIKCAQYCNQCIDVTENACSSCINPTQYKIDSNSTSGFCCQVEFCFTCNPSITCLTCIPNKFLYNNTCLDACPANFTDWNDFICHPAVPCDPSCSKCKTIDWNGCLNCSVNFTMASGPLPNQCCLSHCIVCQDTVTCVTCEAGYFLKPADPIWGLPTDIDQCLLTCHDPQCYDDLDQLCVDTCPVAYTPNITTVTQDYGNCTCVPFLPGTPPELMVCDPTCLTCFGENVDQCNTCKKNSFFQANQCVKKCNGTTYPNDTTATCEQCDTSDNSTYNYLCDVNGTGPNITAVVLAQAPPAISWWFYPFFIILALLLLYCCWYFMAKRKLNDTKEEALIKNNTAVQQSTPLIKTEQEVKAVVEEEPQTMQKIESQEMFSEEPEQQTEKTLPQSEIQLPEEIQVQPIMRDYDFYCLGYCEDVNDIIVDQRGAT